MENLTAIGTALRNARSDRDETARDIAFRLSYGYNVPESLLASYREQNARINHLHDAWVSEYN